MKIAIYARESTDDLNKSPPITEQIERGKAWIHENQHELINIYSDNGFSGGDWKRPAWIQCVTDAKRHYYQILWIWNQDRLARDTEQFLYFYRNLTKSSIRIYEDTSGEFIDMETLGGRVKHQTLAQASEIFRLVTSDKVKKAYERNKKAGKPWGRKKKAFDIDKAQTLRTEGKGWRTIGKELKVSYQTIRTTLINRIIKEQPKTDTQPPINSP